jgi:hypothetical protein
MPAACRCPYAVRWIVILSLHVWHSRRVFCDDMSNPQYFPAQQHLCSWLKTHMRRNNIQVNVIRNKTKRKGSTSHAVTQPNSSPWPVSTLLSPDPFMTDGTLGAGQLVSPEDLKICEVVAIGRLPMLGSFCRLHVNFEFPSTDQIKVAEQIQYLWSFLELFIC